MRCEYQSSFADFKLAQKTYVRSSPRRRFSLHAFLWGLLLTGVVLITLAHLFEAHGMQLVSAILMPLGAGAISGGVTVVLIRPWSMRRVYRSLGGDLKQPRVIYVAVEGDTLISGIKDRSEGRFQRASVCETAEDEAMLLLFVSSKRFLYLPKHAMPTETLASIREWLLLPGAPTRC